MKNYYNSYTKNKPYHSLILIIYNNMMYVLNTHIII